MGGLLKMISKSMLRLSKNKRFETFIILTILVNCVFIALQDPLLDESEQKSFIIYGGYCFAFIFFVEFVVKICGLGPRLYFKDNWNKLDFAVVAESILSTTFILLEYFFNIKAVSGGNVSLLRILRVLRPLKTISFIPEMRLVVRTVFASFQEVLALSITLATIIFIWAGLGYIFFMDRFRYRCYDDTDEKFIDSDIICGDNLKCDDVFPGMGYRCVDSGENPDGGVVSFDSGKSSFILCFQAVTLVGWTRLGWIIGDSYSKLSGAYLLSLIFFGSCCVVNMFPGLLLNKLHITMASIENEDASKLREEQDGAAIDNDDDIDDELKALLNADKIKDEERQDFLRLLGEFEKKEEEDMLLLSQFKTGIEDKLRPPDPKCTPNFCPYFNDLRKLVGHETGVFNISIYVAIILNTACIALDGYGISDTQADVLKKINLVFTFYFMGELVVKLTVFGPIYYFRDNYNKFDFFIVSINLIELIFNDQGSASLLRVGRFFRLARLARILTITKVGQKAQRTSPHLNFGRIINIMMSAFGVTNYVFMLVMLMTFIFAAVGVEVFAGSLGDELFNYNSFSMGFITTFMFITGNRWNEVMYTAVSNTSYAAFFFFMLWILMAKFVLISIIPASVFLNVERDGLEYLQGSARGTTTAVFMIEQALGKCYKATHFRRFQRNILPEENRNAQLMKGAVNFIATEVDKENFLVNLWKTEASYCIFKPESKFRKALKIIYRSKAFSASVILVIIITCVTLTIETDYSAQGKEFDKDMGILMWWIETIATFIFFIELMTATIADGLLLTENSYLKEGFSNRLDFVVTVASILNWLFEAIPGTPTLEISVIKILRLLRVFRAFRLFSKSKEIKQIIDSLVFSMASVKYVLCIVIASWCMFAVIGMTFFTGGFRYCSDSNFPSGKDLSLYTSDDYPNGCFGTITVMNETSNSNYTMDIEILNGRYNYDNFGEALLSTFIIFTFDGFDAILTSAMATQGPNLQPKSESATIFGLYYIVYIFCIILLMSLFNGVQYGTYTYLSYMKNDINKRLATSKDAFWAVYETKLEYVKPSTVGNENNAVLYKKWASKLLKTKLYKTISGVIVLLYIYLRFLVLDVLESGGKFVMLGLNVTTVLTDILIIMCVCFFTFDLFVLKLLSYDFIGIIRKPFYQIDLLLLIASLVDLLMHGGYISGYYYQTGAFKVSDWLRVMCSLSSVKILQSFSLSESILIILLKSLSNMFAIVIIVLLITLVYSIGGVIFLQDVTIDSGSDLLDLHINFKSTAEIMSLLFGVATGDNWVLVLENLLDCKPDDLMWKFFLYFYFCSYVIMTYLICMQLFCLVVIQNYERHNENKQGLSMGQVRAFQKAWGIVCPSGDTKISTQKLPNVIKALGKPLGCSAMAPYIDALRISQKILFLKYVQEETEELEKLIELGHDVKGRRVRDIAFEKIGGTTGKLPPDNRISFRDTIVAAHYNAVFKVDLPFDNEYQEDRRYAKDYLSIFKLAVANKVEAIKIASRRSQYSSPEIAQFMYMERHTPKLYWQRVCFSLYKESFRWAQQIVEVGFDSACLVESDAMIKAIGKELTVVKRQFEIYTTIVKNGSVFADERKAKLADLKLYRDNLSKIKSQITHYKQQFIDVIWNIKSLEPITKHKIPKCSLTAVHVLSDGNIIATGDTDGYLRIFKKKKIEIEEDDDDNNVNIDVTEDDPQEEPTFRYAYTQEIIIPSAIHSIAALVDGRKLFVGCHDGKIRNYTKLSIRGRPNKVEYKLNLEMNGHEGPVYDLQCAASHGSYLLSSSEDCTVKLWRTSGHSSLLTCAITPKDSLLNVPILCCHSFTKSVKWDESFIVVGCEGGIVAALMFVNDNTWLMKTVWEPTCTEELHPGRAISAINVCWGKLYTADTFGTVKMSSFVYEFDSNVPINDTTNGRTIKKIVCHRTIDMHAGPVTRLSFCGGNLFSCSHDSSIVAWKRPEKRKELDLRAEEDDVVDDDHLDEGVVYDKHDDDGPEDFCQPYTSGTITHYGQINDVHGNHEIIASVDDTGTFLIRRRKKWVELVRMEDDTGDDILAGSQYSNDKSRSRRHNSRKLTSSKKKMKEKPKMHMYSLTGIHIEDENEGIENDINIATVISSYEKMEVLHPSKIASVQKMNSKEFLALLVGHYFKIPQCGVPLPLKTGGKNRMKLNLQSQSTFDGDNFANTPTGLQEASTWEDRPTTMMINGTEVPCVTVYLKDGSAIFLPYSKLVTIDILGKLVAKHLAKNITNIADLQDLKGIGIKKYDGSRIAKLDGKIRVNEILDVNPDVEFVTIFEDIELEQTDDMSVENPLLSTGGFNAETGMYEGKESANKGSKFFNFGKKNNNTEMNDSDDDSF